MVYIFQSTDWNQTLKTLKGAHVGWMAAAVGINLFAHWIRGARWNMLTQPAGYTLNARRSFYSVLVGYLVNVGTSRGGELARCAMTARSEKAPIDLLVGTVVTERIIDLMVMACFSLATYMVQFDVLNQFVNDNILSPLLAKVPWWVLLALLGIGIGGILWVAMRMRKKKKADSAEKKGIFQRFAAGVQTVFQLKRPWYFLIQSIGIWTCYWMGAWFLLKALPVTHHFTAAMALSVMVFSAVGIAIPVPAGAAVWAAVAYGLESVYHLPAADANAYGIFNFAFQNLFMIAAGAIAFVLLWLETRKLNGTTQKEIIE